MCPSKPAYGRPSWRALHPQIRRDFLAGGPWPREIRPAATARPPPPRRAIPPRPAFFFDFFNPRIAGFAPSGPSFETNGALTLQLVNKTTELEYLCVRTTTAFAAASARNFLYSFPAWYVAVGEVWRGETAG
jgi:hypothetical protein